MFLKSWRWLIEWPCTFYAPWKLRFRDMTTCYEFTDIDTEIFCPILNFLLARFHRQGQTTSCKVEKEKSMNVLPPCYDACLVRMFCTFIMTSSSWAAFIASCCFTVWNLEVFSWQVPELSEFFLDCWLSDEYKRSELEQERIQRRQCQVNCDGYRIIG